MKSKSNPPPSIPNLIVGDQIVRKILKDLEKVQKSKDSKRLNRCGELIMFIVSSLRKKNNDHLHQTTAVWALMNILKIDTQNTRPMMLESGVPSVLHEFLQSRSLTKTTRQYASELCYFLCSRDPYTAYPESLRSGAIKDVQQLLNKAVVMKSDNDSLSTSVSSVMDDEQLLVPFVPYRISNANMKLMGSIFGKGGDPLLAHSVSAEESFGSSQIDKDKDRHRMKDRRDRDTEGQGGGGGEGGDRSTSDMFSLGEDSMSKLSGLGSSTFSMADHINDHVTDNNGKSREGKQLYSPITPSHSHSPSHTHTSDSGIGIGSSAVRQSSSPSNYDRPSHVRASTPFAAGQARHAVLRPQSQSHSRNGKRPSSVPELPLGATVAATRSRLSVSSGLEPSDFNTVYSKLDPLSASLSVSIQSQAKKESRAFVSKSVKLTSTNSMGNNQMLTIFNAEKLIDMEFTRRLFNEKATLEDMKHTVRRLQDLLELVDKEGSGYVTWECFARVLLAIAPPHLLRAHVVSFLEAQTDSAEDMVDYREFVISGKVMVVERSHGSEEFHPPVTSWFNRQKSVAGDHTTHTWRNHVEWYRQRKSQAVIWLMRRAGRALNYYKRVISAVSSLRYAGVRARKLEELMECGRRGKMSFERRLDAERALIKRSLHARRWRIVQTQAIEFLRKKAKVAVDKAEREIAIRVTPPSLNTIYKIHCGRFLAAKYLHAYGKEALQRVDKRYEAMLWLRALGQRANAQIIVLKRVHQLLVGHADAALAHCTRQDATLRTLIRLGQERALFFMDRQETCLAWLLKRGHRAHQFTSLKNNHYMSLRNKAVFTLSLLNNREDAFKELVRRRENAVGLLARQREVVLALHRFGQSLWRVAERTEEAQLWLVKRARRAIVHSRLMSTAFKRLKFVAARAFVVTRRLTTAYADLREIGVFAKQQAFEKNWTTAPDNRARIKEEEKRIAVQDKKKELERKDMSTEERWEVELKEAFDIIGNVDPLVAAEAAAYGVDPPPPELGKYGFRRLMVDGKLLGLEKNAIDEHFSVVDFDGSGLVSFDELWRWFLHEARRRSQGGAGSKPRVIRFTMSNIVPVRQRAIMVLMRRYLTKPTTASASASRGAEKGLMRQMSVRHIDDA
eukprot:gene4735-9404_t